MRNFARPHTILPLAAIALALPALTQGCSNPLAALSCSGATGAKVAAFTTAVGDLEATATALSTNVGNACVAIATDLGKSPPALGDPSSSSFDDNMKQACNLATAGIQAELSAGAQIAIEIVGGGCSVNADAQFSCEAQCAVDGSCNPGDITVRCDPGELSGECDATCMGSCTVNTGSVQCQGDCSAECDGMCSGSCSAKDGMGNCAGKCSGTCMGGCKGTCSAIPPSAMCSGSCTGGCSVAYKAPHCEGTLKPPMCNIDADCEAGCNAQAQLTAQCTPPQINVTVTGGATGKLGTTLTTNLPALYQAAVSQGKALVAAAGAVANTGVPAIEAAVSIPGCALQSLGNLGLVATASLHVSVSVSASASVYGCASGGSAGSCQMM